MAKVHVRKITIMNLEIPGATVIAALDVQIDAIRLYDLQLLVSSDQSVLKIRPPRHVTVHPDLRDQIKELAVRAYRGMGGTAEVIEPVHVAGDDRRPEPAPEPKLTSAKVLMRTLTPDEVQARDRRYTDAGLLRTISRGDP